jgi:hypothetical protein
MTVKRWGGRLFYVVVLAAALWLNSTWAQSGYEGTIAAECGGDAGCISWMTRVIGCESGWDPNAYRARGDGTGDVGLLQIHDGTWGSLAWAGPYAQISWAADMYFAGGTGHWVCG